MSDTQRTNNNGEINVTARTHNKNQTQTLEKALFSSGSTSSLANKNKLIYGTQDTTNNNGVQGYSQRGNSNNYNNTGQNWRKFITPAGDSLKKLQNQRKDTTSSIVDGSKSNRTNLNGNIPIAITSNSQEASMDNINCSQSINEFTPSQDIIQLKQTIRDNDRKQSPLGNQLKNSSSLSKSNLQLSKLNKNETIHLQMLQNSKIDEESDIDNKKAESILNGLKNQLSHSIFTNDQNGNSQMMKSFMKSLNNNNFQFYDNLHKKYYDKAKESERQLQQSKSQNNQKQKVQNTRNDQGQVLSNSNTMSLSQFNYSQSNNVTQLKNHSVDSQKNRLKQSDTNHSKKNEGLRASSLQDRKFVDNQKSTTAVHNDDISVQISQFSKPTNTMSINCKNSLYNKMKETTLVNDDNDDQSLLNANNINNKQSLLSLVNQNNQTQYNQINIKSFQSSESEEKSNRQTIQDKLYQQEKISKQKREQDILQSKVKKRESSIKNDLLFLENEDRSSKIRHNNLKQHNYKFDYFQNNNVQKQSFNNKQLLESQYQQVLTQSNNNDNYPIQTKQSSQQNSILINSQDDSSYQKNQFYQQKQVQYQQQYKNNYQYQIEDQENISNVILEQPTKEDAYDEDTYKQSQNNEDLKDQYTDDQYMKPDDLKAEDLTTMIDCYQNESSIQIQSSEQQIQNYGNEVYQTYKQIIQKTRQNQQISDEEMLYQLQEQDHSNNKYQKISNTKPSINKNVYQYVSNNPLNTKVLTQQESKQLSKPQVILQSLKNSQLNDDNVGKSDFTFLLSNQTEHKCDCHNIDNSQIQPNTNNNSFQLVQSNFQKQPGLGFQTIVSQSQFNSEFKTNSQLQNSKNQSKGGIQTGTGKFQNGFQNRLTEIAASPIFSEGGGFPGQGICCQYCGGNKQQNRNYQSSRLAQVQQKLNYANQNNNINNINNQSIKEESIIEEEEEEQQQDKQVIKANQAQKMQVEINQNQKYTQVEIKQKHDKVFNQEKQSNQKHTISNNNNIIEDENMTLSQLQQQKIISKQAKNQEIIESINNSICYQNEQKQKGLQQIKGISPIYPANNRKINPKHLKSSLISNDDEFGGIQDSKFKDTVYSYFDEEDELNEESQHQQESFQNYQEQNNSNDENYVLEDQNNEQENNIHQGKKYQKYNTKHQQPNRLMVASVAKVTDLKKSLIKTKKGLTHARYLLKQERRLNIDQEKKLQKLEAEIYALNTRWQITEEKLKSGQNMYQLFQRTNSNTQQMNNTYLTNNNNSLDRLYGQNLNIGNERSKSQTTLIINNASQDIKTSNGSNLMSGTCQQKDLKINQQSPHSFRSKNLSQHTQISQEGRTGISSNLNSSKQLMEINDRLTKQIEENIVIFENLNKEITVKDEVLQDNQNVIQQKEKQIELLVKKINEMGQSMKNLIEVTKQSSQKSILQKSQHQIEIEQLKQKSIQYNEKLQNIQSVFNPSICQNIQGIQNNNQKYSFTQQNQSIFDQNSDINKMMLPCIQLKTPQSIDEISNGGIQTRFNSYRNDQELSIQQLNTNILKFSCQNEDILPIKLQSNSKENESNQNINQNIIHSNDNSFNQICNGKGIIQNQKDQTLINSIDKRVLQSLCNNLKNDSVKGQNQIQYQPSMVQDDSTMLKYSQDISLQKTLRMKNLNQNVDKENYI